MKTSLPLLLLALLSAAPLATLRGEEIRNGSFAEGTRFWFVLVNGGFREPGVIAPFVKNSREGLEMLVDEVPGEKGKPASVTLNQRVQTLKDGVEYVLRVEIKGHNGESLLLALGNPVATGADRGNLSGGIPLREVKLDNTWQILEIPFVYNKDQMLALPTDAQHTQIQFRVGMMTTLRLRSVSVTEKK